MSPKQVRTWRGLGAAAGTVVASVLLLIGGAMSAWPEYLKDYKVGLPVGAFGTLIGFTVGAWWDRRDARRLADDERQQEWESVFTDGPSPIRHYQDTAYDMTSASINPLVLLDPALAVVPFENGHLKHVSAIRRWCIEQKPGRVWLLAGPPGTGKTRTAMRVADHLRRHSTAGWDCGWLKSGPNTATKAIVVASSWSRPVLIVVDDADQRDDLDELLTSAHNLAGVDRNVRLLLIAREFGSWWSKRQARLRLSVDMNASRTWIGPVANSKSRQVVVTRYAIQAFATRLAVDMGKQAKSISGIQADTPIMLLHAAALEAVLRTNIGNENPVDIAEAVASLLDREYEYWKHKASAQDLHFYPQIDIDILRDVLVLATLTGSTSQAGTDELLRLLPALSDAEPELIYALTAWLRVYGTVDGYDIRPQLPAVLADHLITDALDASPDLVSALLVAARTSRQVSFILAVVARATTHARAGAAAAQMLISRDPLRLLPLAILQALDGIGSLDRPIADVVVDAELDWSTAKSLYEQIGGNAEHLLLHTMIALSSVLASGAPNAREYASSITRHAFWLVQAGLEYSGKAIAPSRRAVKLCRELVETDHNAHLPYLVDALATLADALIVTGKPGPEALDVAREAIKELSKLIEMDRDAYLPRLAGTLNTLASILCVTGEPSEAVDASREAVCLLRGLADADPGRYLPLLANGLKTFAGVLYLSARNEAFDVVEEAGIACLQITNHVPYVQAPYIIHAVKLLAGELLRRGHQEEAVALGVGPIVEPKGELVVGTHLINIVSLGVGEGGALLRSNAYYRNTS